MIKMLQNWFLSQCNGDWEHTYGISIETLDNPGWMVKLDLVDTELGNKSFEEISIQRSESDDWIMCKVVDGVFCGFGGPNNLQEILETFFDWIDQTR